MKLKADGMIYDAVLLDKALPAFQTTDKASSGVVRSCLSDCDKLIGCCLSVRYQGGTLMGTSSYYDSMGFLVVNDQNTSEYQATCKTCWRSWQIKQYPDREDKS